MVTGGCPRLSPAMLAVLVTLFAVWGQTLGAGEPEVHWIEPHYGSENGGTKVTIHGANFAAGDPFNYTNSVEFVSETNSYPCEIDQAASDTGELMCYTTKMPEGSVFVRVTIDGVPVPLSSHCYNRPTGSNCRLMVRWWTTPTIETLTPYTGTPGTRITVSGYLFTSLYSTNEEVSTNGKTVNIRRVYVGGQNCNLLNSTGEVIYIQLNNDGTSNRGTFKCDMMGGFVGHINASFIISGLYGRSKPDLSSLRVSSTNELYMIQTYAEITSITPSSGSIAGGTHITIMGRNLEQNGSPVVQVGGGPCIVTQVASDKIICRTPVQQPGKNNYSGNRGLLYEDWDKYVSNSAVGDVLGFTEATDGYQPNNTRIVDNLYFWTSTSRSNFVSRFQGYFVPPRTAEYMFMIWADDSIELYFSDSDDPSQKRKIAHLHSYKNNYWHYDSQRSERMLLTAGNSYYIEVVHKEGGGGEAVSVAARMFESEYTSQQTDYAGEEKQDIVLTSTVLPETQNVKLSSWSTQSRVKEVQQVVLSSMGGAGQYRLGFMGAFTSLIDASAGSSTIQNELNKLPTIKPDTVSVSGSGTVSVTFNTDKGDVDLLEYRDNAGVNITITEQTKGVPSLSNIYLTMDGAMSTAVGSSATSDEVAQAVKDLFSVQCPSELTSPSGVGYEQEFEDPSDSSITGTTTLDVEPFCGRRSLKNPQWLHDGRASPLNLQQYKYVCFARRGAVSRLQVKYEYFLDANTVSRWLTFNLVDAPSWNYTCFDAYTPAKAHSPSEGWGHKMVEVKVQGSGLYYADSVLIASSLPSTDLPSLTMKRSRPPFVNRLMVLDVTVTGSSGDYNITIVPSNCQSDFPLFGVSGAVNTSGDPASNDVTLRGSSWPSGVQVEVTRVQAASPPILGTFDLQYQNEQLTGIPVNIEASDLKDLLQTVSGMGKVDVARTGQCSDYRWTVHWLTAGNKPMMQIDASQATGLGLNITAVPKQDAYTDFDPIIGDMLRTIENNVQVTVSVNNLPVKCDGDCSFMWSEAQTPHLTAATPNSGSPQANTIIQLTGTGFEANATQNTVTIGGTPCDVINATTSQIFCTVGNGPVGTFDILVNVDGKGYANHSSGLQQFTYDLVVTGITPTNGSIGGCTIVTISGSGFASNATATVGGSQCKIVSQDYSSIVCEVPATSAAGQATVTVTQGTGNADSPVDFTYADTATVTSVTLGGALAAVEGGTEITVSGSGFGNAAHSANAVMIGGKAATIVSYNDTVIVATLPGLSTGTYPLKIYVGSTGCADMMTNNIADIGYVLNMTDVQPRRGSVYGGTKLILQGVGFSSVPENNKVMVGSHRCLVSESTSSNLTCTVENTAITHTVTNVVDIVDFYWEPNVLTIFVGDSVRWTWSSPESVTGLEFRVQQTVSASSRDLPVGGFTTGPAFTKRGSFVHRFTAPGSYYYWSDFIDNYGTFMRGVVHVKARPTTEAQVTLRVGDVEAVYVVPDVAEDSNSTTGGNCPGITSLITGCVSSSPNATVTEGFSFTFDQCSSPRVDAISRNQGTSTDDIVIDGVGFSSNICDNVVMFGDFACVISSVNETQIVCRVDANGTFPVGVPQRLAVSIKNRGHAIVSITDEQRRGFVLLPRVDSVQPSEGSLAGGTELIITGDGLIGVAGSAPTVSVGDYGGVYCDVTSSSYTEIRCLTRASTPYTGNVSVTLGVPGGQVPAACAAPSCEFTFSNNSTPILYSVVPQTVSGDNTLMRINGSGFGNNSAGVVVTLGDGVCTVRVIRDDYLECNMSAVSAGNQPFYVRVIGEGYAQGQVTALTSEAVINSVVPSASSVEGGTPIFITGSGFKPGSTSVSIKGSECHVTSVTSGQISCITPSKTGTVQRSADETVDLIVTVDNTQYPSETFEYKVAATPEITGVTPSTGSAGDTVVIAGTGFNSTPAVTIDGAVCNVTDFTTVQITCVLGPHAAGNYPIKLYTASEGNAMGTVEFSYLLNVTSVSPVTGSFGGGTVLTVSGSGFLADGTVVEVCNATCAVNKTSFTDSLLECQTPPNAGSGTVDCDVKVAVNNAEKIMAAAFRYDGSLTPTVDSVEPLRGGTGGGTRITIRGTGFSTNPGENTVSLAGTKCVVESENATTIICVTEPHSPSVRTSVRVEVAGQGAARSGNVTYFYVDRWSSRWTWGGQDPPVAGDFVVIQQGQSILLDVSTPVLKILLIRGGELIFDEADIELQSEIILITDGGLLQVGTEQEPFQHNAIITLFGHHRSKELPIYGTKNIAVRDGRLELHGQHVPITWTHLAATVPAGATEISLMLPVTWKAGDEIVIATTGLRHSQRESEKRTITAVSQDGRNVTLNESLTYSHLGVTETFSTGQSVEMRAEVGLLSHNVKVRGNNDPQWHDAIEACPAGFNTGEFATQTCFQGRFGDEVGSSEFGAHILIHPTVPGEERATAHIEYVELNFVGQAFRLGRYPIHFHLLGRVKDAYVRGCGIHQSFNRAVNIHGSHGVLVERTVIYNIMGGAFFLEDGIETGNTIQYNLAVFVKQSTSLLNDDITPSAFWVTNPNNTIQHNSAAGGTHFAFWYRMHSHPDGPSFTTSVCPKKVPMGRFFNNTGHSLGWFAIWIFQDMFPMEGGGCGSNTPVQAVFDGLVSWHNEKGSEWVNGGALVFNNFVMVDNEKAGIEMKKVMNAHLWSETRGAMINNSLIVGHTSLTSACTNVGIILPFSPGLLVYNTRFINFDSSCVAFGVTSIDGTCSVLCGGWEYRLKNLDFVNSPNKVKWRWEHEGVLHDTDGTFCGTTGCKVVPYNPTIDTSRCVDDNDMSVGMRGVVCEPTVKFHRFAFNGAVPRSLEGKDVLLINSHGVSHVPYMKKRLTHKPGWMMMVEDAANYRFIFDKEDHLTNITYSGVFYGFEPNDYVIMSHNLTQQPDRFSILSATKTIAESTAASLDPSVHESGDYHFDVNNKEVFFLIKGSPNIAWNNIGVNFRVYRCFFADCIPPPDPNTIPPARERPSVFQPWSEGATWGSAQEDDGFGNMFWVTQLQAQGVRKKRSTAQPPDGSNIKISGGNWIVADTDLPIMERLYIYGVLELDHNVNAATGTYHNFVINATYIFIQGGRLIIGWEDSPFLGSAQLVLRGHHHTPDMPLPNGPNMGAKVIGVFGGLDLHGKDRSVVWTQLSQTANPGDNSITVKATVDWEIGDEIVVAPTTYTSWTTETFRITAVSGNVITLNDSLVYKHEAFSETLANGVTYEIAAEVGLLSRNIKIIGATYDNLYVESFGARLIVGRFIQSGTEYRGYARISNVEFYHSGQEGWMEPWDPRYSIAWVNAGSSDNMKPSYLKKSTFNENFSPAIGVFDTSNITVTGNVVYRTVGAGIVVQGSENVLRDNLVVKAINQDKWLNTGQAQVMIYEGGIEVDMAEKVVVTGNHVAGAERTAFKIRGETCPHQENGVEPFAGNVAHSALLGVDVFYLTQTCSDVDCVKISNFFIYKAWDFGVYHQTACDIEASGLVIVDSSFGFFPLVITPSATGHAYKFHYANLSNSTFVGNSPVFDCNDKMDSSDLNVGFTGNSRSIGQSKGSGTMSTVGVSWPGFYSGANNAPGKPFAGIMTYPAIAGVLNMKGNHFAHYKSVCTSKRSFAVGDNPGNADALHPISASGTSFEDVEEDSKVFIHRSNLGKVNPSDCVDMECDAQKKAMMRDEDNTFLAGTGPAAIIPDSAFEWNGDRRRGLGDYRIPKTLLTELDGTRIPVANIAPYKGIIGTSTSSCTWKAAWQAYACHGLDYEMLIIESLDADTELRRLSPVAILGDQHIDLINGPQDHGWCAGYTCQKRLSTFNAIVATGKHFEMHYTSTSPQKSRFFLLNANETQAVRLAVWYANPQRLVVKVNGQYINAKNIDYDKNNREIFKAPSFEGEFWPDIANDPTGANFFDRNTGLLYFLVRGSTPVSIDTLPTINVAFNMPALTVDEFFGENIINNLAAFLDIPKDKIRIVKIVRSTDGSRKKRATGTMKVEIEIGNSPSNGSVTDNSTTTNPGDLDFATLQNVTAKIYDATQLGTLSTAMNVTVLDVSIVEPAPSPSDPAWAEVANQTSPTVVITVPTTLSVSTQPVGAMEGNNLTQAPILQMYDNTGTLVTSLGSTANPWEVTATIRAGTGHASAQLSGVTKVQYKDGMADFSGLQVTHAGSGYILDFTFTKPAEASGFSVSSSTFDVSAIPLAAIVTSVDRNATVGAPLSAVVQIVVNGTNAVPDDISWKGHTWTATASLYSLTASGATLSGVTTATFNASNQGQATFSDLRISHTATYPKRYFIQFDVTTSPADYNLQAVSSYVEVQPSGYVAPTEEVSHTGQWTFQADYDAVVAGKEEYMKGTIWNFLMGQYTNATFRDITVAKGSIIVSFVIYGGQAEVNDTLFKMYDDLLTGLTLTFNGQQITAEPSMLLDSVAYYGSVGPPTSEPGLAPTGLPLYVIIVIVIVAILLTVLFVGIVVWKLISNKHNMKVASVEDMRHEEPDEREITRRTSYLPLQHLPPSDSPMHLVTSLPPASTAWAVKPKLPPIRGKRLLHDESLRRRPSLTSDHAKE
ncbi:fibrocystin-L [Lingula anatina]|uniref:Fibrocystin-L n=1 Tax=Lingula anatina TaxID=7574 RepID=A0A1S3J4H2_LINAN|nr:fibrocystin-L [Lingula anatina]|eukprot:XP_013405337.2 fibrocystin-L [Lingula anatina]